MKGKMVDLEGFVDLQSQFVRETHQKLTLDIVFSDMSVSEKGLKQLLSCFRNIFKGIYFILDEWFAWQKA